MPRLTDPIRLAGHTAPDRVVFGPHETNLGDGRALSERHVAYYARRTGGIVVTETASVHPSDRPYERAPLAAECGPGWREVADALAPRGALLLAGLGHAGGEGSSAHTQAALWAPSRFVDPAVREVPVAMEDDEIDALVGGFADAATVAVTNGCHGVEIDAGPGSLLRQFRSGLSNQRDDAYGRDRLLLTRRVLAAVRGRIGSGNVLALRLCADELAPWAGITPDQTVADAAALAELIDLLVVVRGGPYSAGAYRPDLHTPSGMNRDVCARVHGAVAGRVPVVLQGSVVDVGTAQSALDDGIAEAVEMTRAQIADAELVAKLRRGDAHRIRPCILCNQACRVRDDRNPVVSCAVDPRSGHETEDADVEALEPDPAGHALVAGAGPAGLEAARVLAGRGWSVRVVDRAQHAGGALRPAIPGRERFLTFVDWQVAECRILGVSLELGADADADADVVATGARFAARHPGALDPAAVVESARRLVPGAAVLVDDPVGGPVGIAVADYLAARGLSVGIVTPDPVVGRMLAYPGGLADANARLQRAGVVRHVRSRLRDVTDTTAVLEDVWTGQRCTVPCSAVVDCGPRVADGRPGANRAGDCVAPRTLYDAVLDGRRAALAVARRPVGAAR